MARALDDGSVKASIESYWANKFYERGQEQIQKLNEQQERFDNQSLNMRQSHNLRIEDLKSTIEYERKQNQILNEILLKREGLSETRLDLHEIKPLAGHIIPSMRRKRLEFESRKQVQALKGNKNEATTAD